MLRFPRVLPFWLLLSALSLTAEGTTACIHIRQGAQAYAVSYLGQPCSHPAFSELPNDTFEAVAAWAYNCTFAKLFPRVLYFRIEARLATRDLSETHGVAHGPCSYGRWSDYGWTHHADHAYLGIVDAIGQAHPCLVAFRKAALASGLARKDRFYGISFREKRLSVRQRQRLELLFREFEAQLAGLPELSTVGMTFEEKYRKQPWTRPTFTLFDLLDGDIPPAPAPVAPPSPR